MGDQTFAAASVVAQPHVLEQARAELGFKMPTRLRTLGLQIGPLGRVFDDTTGFRGERPEREKEPDFHGLQLSE